VRNVRELGKYAADLGLCLALELEPFRLSLVRNVETMAGFLDDVDHPAVRANIDISHLQLSQTPPAEVARLRGRAIHPYLREIKALDIDGAVSIELEYSPEPERIVEWVREAYEATDRLMRQVGLRG
jgi:D-psicose/D-tagatose/L-ribulose 3-epimerase